MHIDPTWNDKMTNDVRHGLAAYYSPLKNQNGENKGGTSETYGFWMGIADELLAWLRVSAHVVVDKQDERFVLRILSECAEKYFHHNYEILLYDRLTSEDRRALKPQII